MEEEVNGSALLLVKRWHWSRVWHSTMEAEVEEENTIQHKIKTLQFNSSNDCKSGWSESSCERLRDGWDSVRS